MTAVANKIRKVSNKAHDEFAEACRVLGHIEKAVYVDCSGDADDFYCTRCGVLL